MKFTIITPTYKRPDNLRAAVQSVKNQLYQDWHMIIVNDSPSDASYENIEKEIKKDPKITYVKNDMNRGVNFSRNRALGIIEKNVTADDWIIFLDDDDTLAQDALQTIAKVCKENPNESWILTNRATYEGISFTKVPLSDTEYSYAWDYLIAKKVKSDATHCIRAKAVGGIRFPNSVKQGEEWLFFYELSLHVKKFFYHNYNTTLSFGYGPDGLNFRKRTKKERFFDLYRLKMECLSRNMLWHPTLWLYFLMRSILLIVR